MFKGLVNSICMAYELWGIVANLNEKLAPGPWKYNYTFFDLSIVKNSFEFLKKVLIHKLGIDKINGVKKSGKNFSLFWWIDWNFIILSSLNRLYLNN